MPLNSWYLVLLPGVFTHSVTLGKSNCQWDADYGLTEWKYAFAFLTANWSKSNPPNDILEVSFSRSIYRENTASSSIYESLNF